MARLVYRGGSRTSANLTPRETDCEGRRGQAPGLSTFEAPDRFRGRVQVIDLERLRPPLRGIPDQVEEGGTPGHVSIAPVTHDGRVDAVLLAEWAGSRARALDELDYMHGLTRIVYDAVVETP